MRILPIRTALISVFDKREVTALGRRLAEHEVAIYSTGGTARALREADIALTPVDEVTGQAEIFDGRVKTLHPKIHGGILARRGHAGDEAVMQQQVIQPIDLVVVNLYPFGQAVATRPDDVAHAVENIDIGGPTMVRAAAKNHRDVCVIVDPEDYAALLEQLARHGGVEESFARQCAVKAFQHTAAYDAAVSAHFQQAYETAALPVEKAWGGRRVQSLRYGENPHQRAAFYAGGAVPTGLADIDVLQGKALSYNNLLDLDAAWRTVLEFAQPAAVVIKHTNPCGVALGDTLEAAYTQAREVAPVSAFGSVVAFNRPLDEATAAALTSTFVECVLAPGVEPAAAERMRKKKNLRLVVPRHWPEQLPAGQELRAVFGGLLVQDSDTAGPPQDTWNVVSQRAPSKEELAAMAFGWKVAKHVKSNAIVYARPTYVLGVGAGQMSRVDASKLAVSRAREGLAGSALVSDAFFPFRDGLDAAAEAGATAVIQPGGSIRDDEVIAAADEHDMAMVFTGMRHFRH